MPCLLPLRDCHQLERATVCVARECPHRTLLEERLQGGSGVAEEQSRLLAAGIHCHAAFEQIPATAASARASAQRQSARALPSVCQQINLHALHVRVQENAHERARVHKHTHTRYQTSFKRRRAQRTCPEAARDSACPYPRNAITTFVATSALEGERAMLLNSACESAMERLEERLDVVGSVCAGLVGGDVVLTLVVSVSGWTVRRGKLMARWLLRYLQENAFYSKRTHSIVREHIL